MYSWGVNQLLKQLRLLYRYSVWGVASFLLELVLLSVFLQAALLPYYLAVPLAFAVATSLFWLFCHVYVFAKSGFKVKVEYEVFFLIQFVGLLIVTGLVVLFVNTLGVPVVVARILSSVFTGLWNFYLHARFNFRAHAFLHR